MLGVVLADRARRRVDIEPIPDIVAADLRHGSGHKILPIEPLAFGHKEHVAIVALSDGDRGNHLEALADLDHAGIDGATEGRARNRARPDPRGARPHLLRLGPGAQPHEDRNHAAQRPGTP